MVSQTAWLAKTREANLKLAVSRQELSPIKCVTNCLMEMCSCGPIICRRG